VKLCERFRSLVDFCFPIAILRFDVFSFALSSHLIQLPISFTFSSSPSPPLTNLSPIPHTLLPFLNDLFIIIPLASPFAFTPIKVEMDDKKDRSNYRNLIHVPTHNFLSKIKTRNVKCSALFHPSLPASSTSPMISFNANVNQFKYSEKRSACRKRQRMGY
jgi:hypothetical protein